MGDKVKINCKLASGGSLTLADATLIGNTTDNTFVSGTEYTISTSAESVHLDIISSSNNNYIEKVTVTPYYDITVTQPTDGTVGVKVGNADVTTGNTTAPAGQTITLSNTPADNYTFTSYSVTKTASGDAIELTENSFTMPKEAVTITATFTQSTPAVTEISSVEIAGLVAPEKGVALKTLSDLSTTTTGASISSITWDPTTTPAAASTAYTATIVLEASNGYQFASTVTANEIAGKTAAVTRTDDTHITVAYTFDETEAEQEASISAEKTWTFNTLTENTVYNTVTQIDNDYYLRALVSESDSPNRTFTVKSGNQALSFIDGKGIETSKYIEANGQLNTSKGTAPAAGNTAGDATKAGLPSFAFNASVAGTTFAKIKYTGNASDHVRHRMYFANADGTTAVVNVSMVPTSDIDEVKMSSNAAGSFFITDLSGNGKYEIYAVRFVPATTIKVPTGLTGGTVIADKTTANENDEVTLTVTPADGYHLKDGSLKAYYISANGTEIEVNITNNKFTKPAYYVYVKAEFEENTAPTVTTAPSAVTPTYTGEAQNLVTAGEVTGGTIQFSTTSATEGFDTAIPQGTNAGSYNVWWKVVGDETHTDLAAAQIENVTIAKATPTISKAPTASAITAGQTLANSNLTGGEASVDGTFAWTDNTLTPSVSDSQTTNYGVTFTPTDTYNYNTTTTNVMLTVNSAGFSPTVSITGWTYGETPNTPSVESNTSGGEVTYTYYTDSNLSVQTTIENSGAASDGAVPVYAGTYYVKATIAANGNYGEATASTSFTIAKAAGSISYTTASVEKSTTDAAFTNELTKTGDGTVTYGSSDANVATVNETTGEVTIVGAGTTTITATVADGTNYTYETKTATYTLTATAPAPQWTEVNDFTNLYTNKDNITVVVDKFANEESVCNDPVDDSTKKTITYEYKGNDDNNYYGITVNGISFQLKRATNATKVKFVLSDNYLAIGAASRITIPSLTAGKIVTIKAKTTSSKNVKFTLNSGGEAYEGNPSDGAGSTALEFKYKATGGGDLVLTTSDGNPCIEKITIYDTYTVTAVPEDENYGTATVETSWIGDNKYEKTSNVEVTAAGLGDYAFDHWSVAGNDNYSTENPLTIENLSADIALTAHYRARVTYTFSATVNPEAGGTITAYKDDDETNAWTIVSPVYEGTKIKLVAGANDGYTFVNWKKGSTVVSTEATYTIESLSENTELTANFISTSSIVPVILTAGQSNTDGRISDAIPSDFTGLTNCYWSYCNAQNVPSGTFLEENRRYTPGFELFTPRSDNGTCWGYDAVVYDLVGKALNSNFYVVKQSKGNTAVSPDAGGCGVYWGADNIYRRGDSWAYDTTWFGNQTSVNSGGLSLLKGFIENIDASMSALETDGKHGDIKFMLWHQGECDGGSGNTAFAYYENLKAVVNYIRNYLATNYDSKYATLPFICGTVAKNSKEYHAYVENALYRLQKDLTNFYVVNMSQGTFIADGVHFNQESAVRLGKKMYNKVVENGYITGSTVEVDDVDAQIYNENTYDFQNWAYVNSEITTKVGGTNPAYKAISLGSAVDGTDNTLFVLNNPTKDEGMQTDMNLNGRFALSSVTSNGASNDDVNFRISQNNNGTTGLHTKAFSGTIPTFSILNLNAGDAITIKCSTDALTFKSTNAYLESDETKTKVTERTKWVTGTTYIVTSGNRLDFSFGNSSAQQYIYSVVIEPAKVTETVADPVISNSLDNNTATVTISVANTELGNTPAIYYTTDGTEPSVNNGTQYTEPLLLTTETTIKAVAVINGLTSNVVSKVIYTNDDANTGKDDDIYDFQTWVTEMGAKGTLTRGGSDITVEGSNKVKQIQNIYASGKENNFMETHGRFAINANADVGYDKNDETKRGLRTNGDGRTAYFSILNLKSGDNITINNGVTVEGKSALRFVSTNAHKKGSTTTPSGDVDNRTVWTSGDTWVMDADGRLDLMLGDEGCMAYIYSIRISNRENVAAATFAKDADDDNKLIITAGTTDVETATTYYTLDGTEPTTSSTAITSSPLTLALTQDTTLITLTVGSTGKTARGYYQFTYTDTTPTAAKTFDFFNIYKNDPTFDLQMEDATKRTAYFAKKDGESMVDNSGNFYAIKASPIDSIIAWREKHVELTANGLKPTNADRPFVIRDLKKNDVIRIEFDGDIYYAKHSTRGNALKDMEPGDAITTRTAYKVASVDDTYNYVVFYPTKATTISQISINEELTPHVLPTVPSVAFSKVEEGKSVYTITYQDGETLHYQLGSDSQVDVTTASPYSLKIDKSATLSAWTSTDDGESGKLSYGVYAPTDSVYADGVYDFIKVAGTTPVEIVTSEQTVGGQTVYAPNAITAATFDRRFAFSSITGTDVRLIGGTGMRVAKGKNIYIALKNLEKDKVFAINFTSTSGDDGIKFKSVSILDGATVDANVVSGKEYTINEGGNILLQVSNANASLDITSIKLGSKMKTEQADVQYQVVNNEATVTGFTTAETASEITVPASVDGAPVTAIAEGTFTEENTANVTSIDLSETAVTFDSGTTRETVDELKNINSATLIYLPSTANVTGTNVVTKGGTTDEPTYTCDDYQIKDGQESSVPHAFTAAQAKITRTFTSGVKCTVCLPYQFTASGGSFYQFTGISDGMVEMTEQTGTLDANTPYIFVPSSDATEGASASNVTVSISDAPETVDAANHFTFKGTFEKTIWDEATAEGIYGFAANAQDGAEVGQFVRVGASASIDAYRAYLKYEGEGTLNGPSSAPRRTPIVLPNTLSIKWISAQDGATTIRNIEVNDDGDAPAYNLSGQRVGKDYKGIVIVNGKKVRK